VIATTQSNTAPLIGATVATAEQSDIDKAMKDGTDKFSEGTPKLINALDELKASYPFIGGELVQ